ncbi:penicillin acylase family protein [Pedobacter sp. P351]|uniref:penicillin acylase family protein n=1 Tax=Pedobacter superstes TaxID=3133441 RepID=UPI0030A9D422
MKIVKALLSIAFSITLLVLLNIKLGSVPPLGKFLSPFFGFWQNAERQDLQNAVLHLKELKSKVQISYDEHQVPHIFAGNEYDLYFAQGYVTAKDRLWQLDFQTRFAAGTLSEVIGKKALELDKYQRRLGMGYGAENMVKELEKYPRIKAMTQAYADGINAYISTLNSEKYPIEFKILDYKPIKWTILNTALLLKLMSATLAGGSDEFYMSNALRKFGPEVMNDLFPDYPFRDETIIPRDTKWDFKADIQAEHSAPVPANTTIATPQKNEGIGSNNWAVSGSKTASGYPLLANDPHLNLTLPAIWYQTQLIGPGINVYGVSIPGAPGIVIGFNQKVAWGVTNVGADVLDWYRIKFKDKQYKHYWHNNEWKTVKKRIETIHVRGHKTISDTVLYTHHGPVVYLHRPDFIKANNVPEGYALRWIAHDPSADIATFYYLNRAENYEDYRKALSYYTAPAQNFVFASVDNDISLTAAGYFPRKNKGNGKFLLDGTNAGEDWQSRIPFEQNPSVKNPTRGFVSSANQNPANKSYPYYLNWEFAGYERGNRINTRLSKMEKVNIDSMRNLQTDNYSVLAKDVLPTMLSLVKKGRLNASEREAFNLIQKWEYKFDPNEIAASIFEIWQKDIYNKIWADEFTNLNSPMRFPNRDRTVHLFLEEPDSKWFDNITTPKKETREDIVNAAFKFTIDSLEGKFGHLGKSWEWANVKHSNVPHLAKIAGFGSRLLYNGGSKTSVNALNESHGPSWRMVVSLGKVTKGYGVFPGGQSGNPGSFYYDDLLNTWTSGELNELLFLRSATKKNSRIKGHLTLTH